MGIADRACFDLQQHAKATNTNMTANEIFKTPIEVEVGQVKFNKKVMGKQFKRAAKQLYADIEEALGDDVALAKKLDDDLTADGKATFKSCNGEVELTREMLEIKVVKKKLSTRKYVLADTCWEHVCSSMSLLIWFCLLAERY